MGKRFAGGALLSTAGFFVVTLLIPSGAVAQEKGRVQYKVIKPQDFVKSTNPNPNERVRVDILTGKEATIINGIFASLPPASSGVKLGYHYHKGRESVIQILSGDATEMIEGKPVPLAPGDVIFIPSNIKHTLLNNSSTTEVKYMEFYSPIAPDSVQVEQ